MDGMFEGSEDGSFDGLIDGMTFLEQRIPNPAQVETCMIRRRPMMRLRFLGCI